ncbi:MAG: S8 family serine peptidase [Candidatus Nanoarchaeia archaeon]
MKKRVVLGVLFALLFALIFISSQGSQESKIDKKVYENIEAGAVNVIVEVNQEEKGIFIKRDLEDKKEDIIKSLDKDEEKVREQENLISVKVSLEELKKLEKNSDVDRISLSPKLKAFLQNTTIITNATLSWPVQINEINLTGNGETICVLDTGVNFSHPDLIGKNKTCIVDCFEKECTPNCSVIDDNGHGTHVAGIISANGGIKGIAPGSSIIALKILDENGEGSDNAVFDLTNGIKWCIEKRNTYNISIITMSLGTVINYSSYCDSSFTSTLTKVINNATFYNISIIAASGNSGNISAMSAPACINNVTSVGATTKLDAIASYSNRNNLTDLFAPGGSQDNQVNGINSTYNDGTYEGGYGTSMAAPHVAGAFAVVRQFYILQSGRVPTSREIQNTLNATGKIINDASSLLNFSRIDIYSAIKEMDILNPEVELISPNNNNNSRERNQTFFCSANDVQLKNITFYIWNETGIYNSSFVNVTQGQIVSFNVTLVPGAYQWNCKAEDENGNFSFAQTNYTISISGKQLIFIGVDGFQYNHYVEMLQAGDLGNFTRLMSNNGWNGTVNITGHSNTETAPGNAELHTGLNESLNLVRNNTQKIPVAENKTEYERIKNFDGSIKVGSVYGKDKDYLAMIFNNSHAETDWWQNRSTYSPLAWTDGTACDNSLDVATKATEFIGNYTYDLFYLFVYFGAPDCSGHEHGENSLEYNNSFKNVDDGLGVILDYLEDNNLNDSVQIIISSDHGWNEGTTYHSTANSDTITLPLITNNITLVRNITSDGVREQCEIVPTILDYFEVPKIQYQDIIDNGCDSMLGDITSPLIESISSSASQTLAILNITTNENANASINYGTSLALGSISTSTEYEREHLITLSGLASTSVYFYNITICDIAGNCRTNGTNNFTTLQEEVTSSSSSSSGGGSSSSGSGGGSGAKTYLASYAEISSGTGYTKEFSLGDRLKFNLINNNLVEEHTINISRIYSTKVDLIIASEIILTSIQIGEIKKFDLNSDGVYDLEIKLNSIINNKSSITIKAIEMQKNQNSSQVPAPIIEDKVEEKNNKRENYNDKLLFLQIGILLLIIALIIAIIAILKKHKNINNKHKTLEEYKQRYRQRKA